MLVRVSSSAPSREVAATVASVSRRTSPLSTPRVTIPATIAIASSNVWRVEPARKAFGVRATSSSSTRTAAGAVRKTSMAKRQMPASCSGAVPGPSLAARSAWRKYRPLLGADALQQRFLVLEVVVDEAVGDARLPRHVGDAAAVVTLLGEDVHGRVQDRAPLLRLGGIAARSRRALRWMGQDGRSSVPGLLASARHGCQSLARRTHGDHLSGVARRLPAPRGRPRAGTAGARRTRSAPP